MNAQVAEFVVPVRIMSYIAARCAVGAAYSTYLYREPGQSISGIDERLGLKSDVEDPLLSAHRFAKFYLISAGDCVDSMSQLLSADHPNFVGAAALARTAAEHSSRSMYLSDPGISYQVRLIRSSLLVANSLREYKSSHDEGATSLINAWARWRARTGVEFQGVPKQTLGTATDLIQRYFVDGGARSYEELSRPTHGNAVWLAITVVQEQKQTAVARIMLMRNAMFATRCVVAATNSIASLWELDLDTVVSDVSKGVFTGSLETWNDFERSVLDLSGIVAGFDERQFSDSTPVPQPRR